MSNKLCPTRGFARNVTIISIQLNDFLPAVLEYLQTECSAELGQDMLITFKSSHSGGSMENYVSLGFPLHIVLTLDLALGTISNIYFSRSPVLLLRASSNSVLYQRGLS